MKVAIDAEPELSGHGGNHIGIVGDGWRVLTSSHTSMILELYKSASSCCVI